MKKLDIEKTKPIFMLGGLSFLDFQIFSNKTSLANKWMIFSSSNSALA